MIEAENAHRFQRFYLDQQNSVRVYAPFLSRHSRIFTASCLWALQWMVTPFSELQPDLWLCKRQMLV